MLKLVVNQAFKNLIALAIVISVPLAYGLKSHENEERLPQIGSNITSKPVTLSSSPTPTPTTQPTAPQNSVPSPLPTLPHFRINSPGGGFGDD